MRSMLSGSRDRKPADPYLKPDQTETGLDEIQVGQKGVARQAISRFPARRLSYRAAYRFFLNLYSTPTESAKFQYG